jgi:hypothetical protein
MATKIVKHGQNGEEKRRRGGTRSRSKNGEDEQVDGEDAPKGLSRVSHGPSIRSKGLMGTGCT